MKLKKKKDIPYSLLFSLPTKTNKVMDNQPTWDLGYGEMGKFNIFFSVLNFFQAFASLKGIIVNTITVLKVSEILVN